MDQLHTSRDSQLVTFLPVNEPSSPATHRAKRASQSCDNCRDNKKKCEQRSPEGSCRRCVEGGRVCRTTQQRKRRKLKWTSNKQDATSTPKSEIQAHSVSDQGVPLAPDEESEGRELLQRAHKTKEQILSTDLLDARDALDLIAVAGSRERMGERLQLNDRQGLNCQTTTQRPEPTPAIPPSKTDLDGFFLVRKGIARPCEVNEYLGFYFTHLWQVFPVIPQWYAVPERYAQLVLHEPVLAISLVALASRYHHLSGLNGAARSERVHWRTWPWVQRLFQSAMWGSAGMRSYGAIAALLLSIEWHPRAINSPEDFVGDHGEPDLFEPSGQEDRPGHSIPERLNLVATAHRSNRMSWILLSTSISLAEEIGCFEDQSGRVHAEHRTPDSVQHVDWPNILCTFLRITDGSLSLRLRLESQLRGLRSVEIADCIPSTLAADGFWEITADLATQMGKARDLLRSWRKSQHGTGPSIPLAAWDSFRRGLDRWKKQRQLNNRDISLRDACLDIEYYYVRICGLSPAAHMFESATASQDSHAMGSLSRFADDATVASIDLLDYVIYNVAPSSFFKYAPVKTWLYIVCAALYLLKVTLKMEERLDGSNPRIFRILSAVDAIKQNAPDDIHMAQRYATLLDILVSAATRSSSNATHSVTQDEEAYRTSGTANYLANTYLDGQILDSSATGDSIYDPDFWDSLPEMIGLNNVPDLFMPVYE